MEVNDDNNEEEETQEEADAGSNEDEYEVIQRGEPEKSKISAEAREFQPRDEGQKYRVVEIVEVPEERSRHLSGPAKKKSRKFKEVWVTKKA